MNPAPWIKEGTPMCLACQGWGRLFNVDANKIMHTEPCESCDGTGYEKSSESIQDGERAVSQLKDESAEIERCKKLLESR